MDPQTESSTPAADHDRACFEKAREKKEPTFTLRAQDRSAAETIEFWAALNALELGPQHPKILDAREIAAKMRSWPLQRQAD